MQGRMKRHQLDKNQVENLLMKVETGSLSTLNLDGSPYIIPVHFVYFENKIYFHGLPKGKKLDNIKNDSRVSFCAYEMDKFLLDSNEKPCDTNTQYESVNISGVANIITDLELKGKILREIVKKYTPNLIEKEIPDNMLRGTAVVEISINELTGKYYG